MKYYKGIQKYDKPQNGGSYVTENEDAHECYNFDPVDFADGTSKCLGFVMLTGGKGLDSQIKIENIVGCNALKNEEKAEGVTVVWCAKPDKNLNIRVMGFYKNATVFRRVQTMEFENDYIQCYSFVADKKDCVLLPYQERCSNNQWYVPMSGKNNSTFGFGRAGIWYGGNNTDNEKEIQFVERMIESTENYDGENWIERYGDDIYEF